MGCCASSGDPPIAVQSPVAVPQKGVSVDNATPWAVTEKIDENDPFQVAFSRNDLLIFVAMIDEETREEVPKAIINGPVLENQSSMVGEKTQDGQEESDQSKKALFRRASSVSTISRKSRYKSGNFAAIHANPKHTFLIEKRLRECHPDWLWCVENRKPMSITTTLCISIIRK